MYESGAKEALEVLKKALGPTWDYGVINRRDSIDTFIAGAVKEDVQIESTEENEWYAWWYGWDSRDADPRKAVDNLADRLLDRAEYFNDVAKGMLDELP